MATDLNFEIGLLRSILNTLIFQTTPENIKGFTKEQLMKISEGNFELVKNARNSLQSIETLVAFDCGTKS